MKRKTFVKKMRGFMAKCHEISRAAGPVTYRPGKTISGVSSWQLPEGQSYQEVYCCAATVLLPIIAGEALA